MKITSFLALSMFVALATSSTSADAGRRRSFGGGHSNFQSNGTFGLGLELGEPSGLNGKYFLTPSGALDFGVGYIYDHYYAGDGIHLYADYLWHPFLITKTEPFQMPFYVGVGGRYWHFDWGCDRGGNNCAYDASAFGVRVPVGLAFDFNNVPLDIFIQLTPVLDFFSGYDRDGFDHDRVHLGIDFSVGIRFWFN
jgi:hypothetical protein